MQDESQHNEVTVGSDGAPITVGPIRFDTSQWAVIVDGKLRRLTPGEYKVLHFLAINANTVCTSNQIVSHVFGYNDAGDTSLIKSHIRHLRQKIEPDPRIPTYILTIPDVGYTLVSHDHDESIQL